MTDEILTLTRYGEAFWRAHHEAWRRSELNQREYCEAILSYAISSFCPTSADGLHHATSLLS